MLSLCIVKRIFSIVLLLLMPLGGITQNDSLKIVQDVEFIWQDDFNPKEQAKAKKWLYSVAVSTQKLLGKYPFPLRFFIRKREQSYGPLVGCHAKFAADVRGVYLGIDLRYPEEDFMKSWKTPHEISHLALPALGRQNAWFFEGFATFMSRQILQAMGYYSEEELEEIYKEKFSEIKADFNKTGTFVDVIKNQTGYYNYKAFYWGGATFFYRADKVLRKKHKTTMCEVVKTYQEAERKDDRSLLMVIKSWDRIVGSDVFTQLMIEYRNNSAASVMERY